jgi:hypothetical protein
MNHRRAKWPSFGLNTRVLLACAALASCSESEVDKSSELFSAAADVHLDQAIIQQTIEKTRS